MTTRALLIGLAFVGCSRPASTELEQPPPLQLTTQEVPAVPGPPRLARPMARSFEQAQGPFVPVPPLSISSTVSTAPAGSTRLSEVRTVTVGFTLLGKGAAGEASVVFTAPGGTAYEKREARLEDTPFEAQRLELVVPVAGTTIDTARMAGTWTATLYLNGSEAASSAFELTR